MILSSASPLGVALSVAAAIAYAVPAAAASRLSERAARGALVAAWILVMASRPLSATKVLILAGMYAGLVLLFTVPLTQEFFRVELPPTDLLVPAVAVAAAGCLAIEFIGRTTLRRAASGGRKRLGPLTLEPASGEGEGRNAGHRDGPASI